MVAIEKWLASAVGSTDVTEECASSNFYSTSVRHAGRELSSVTHATPGLLLYLSATECLVDAEHVGTASWIL